MHSRCTRLRKCFLGSGLPGAFSQQWRRSAAAAAATQERLRKCGGRQGGDTGIAITHSPQKTIVSSSRRSAIARNSAQSLRRTIVVPLHVHVLSRARPSPDSMVKRCARVRGGRGMFTLSTPRAKRVFHVAWHAPTFCLNVTSGLNPRGDIQRFPASNNASNSVSYRGLSWTTVTVWRNAMDSRRPLSSAARAIHDSFDWVCVRKNQKLGVMHLSSVRIFLIIKTVASANNQNISKM